MHKSSFQRNLPLILVVDDDKSVRVLLSRAMEQEGYHVLEACNGRECIEIFLEYSPDLILLDGNMPEMDGISCCLELKSLPDGESTPVLIVTSEDDEKIITQAFDAGATDYITKPPHLPVLRQRVKRLLQERWLVEELRQQSDREKLLRNITQKIFHQSLKFQDILDTTVAEVRDFLQADRVVIYQLTYSADGKVLAESVSPCWAILQDELVQRSWFERQLHRFHEGAPWVVNDFRQVELSEPLAEFVRVYQVEASLEVPIMQQRDGKLWGILAIHQCYKPRVWQKSEIDALQQLSTQVSIAIHQSYMHEHIERANKSLERRVSLDGLTQVANRRRFDEYLNQEWWTALHEQTPISLVICDVDHFKLYNDHYRHGMGDECLKRVAGAIERSVKRQPALVARYGGEEFAIVLPQTDADMAVKIGWDVHNSIKELKIPHEKSLTSRFVTMSLGVASTIPTRDSAASMLLDIADKALYQAKQQGRSQVILGHFSI